MFDKNYEQRLEDWSEFRESLEDSEDPFRELIDYYRNAPYVSIHTDPWNKDTWPSPWELVHENQYDDFCRVLGMCYSLQLTERFKDSKFEIHICTINNLGHLYLLFVDDLVFGIDDEKPVSRSEIPGEIDSQEIYRMPGLH
jgi:hypothetical protein